jgi:L-ascorbate metabolism protein UlaG (beta-lactamase superfamily)
VRLRLIRHATLVVDMAGRRLLVDPLLSEPGALPAVDGTPNQRPNPLVPLPMEPSAVLAGVEAVLVTHLDSDHFDPVAAALLPHDVPVLCQPEDLEALTELGFEDVRPVRAVVEWRGLRLTRIGGRHGTGELGERMGPVSGWVLAARHEPVLYLAGDTIWAPEVEDALAAHRPSVTVVNAGEARLLEGDPITMGVEDVLRTAAAAPTTTVVAVHMDAVSHCGLGRAELRDELEERRLDGRVLVPEDGEALDFGA